MLEHNISNKDLTIFLLVTFGLTTGMGIAMAFVYTKYTMGVFSKAQAYYPAIGVMIALLLNKEKRKKLPMKFYGSYLFFTITSILFLLVEIFVFHKNPDMYIECWMIVGSITTLLMCSFPSEKESLYNFGLGFGKNVKTSLGCILLFFVLYICTNILNELIFGSVKEIITFFKDIKIFMQFIFLLPFWFLFQFILFLGEEYGWRYFLQTALQRRLGKRKGIIILGIIWGIWHLPLSLFHYRATISFYSILDLLICCIPYAIFFGFVYMKTENIWTVSIIHFFNNFFGAFIFNSSTGANGFGHLICMFIVYLPFLFTKEYRKYEEEIELTNGL
ncbi:CPBP family intramembrane glutamic endopeptidase [Clostridium lundense]|uniref:CPBP family intramembrane glutamic endopeptidase n=1 Tax=Clostridium lundense TaxID=319475 RepID=UPI000483C4EC|nr:CPBP family intramembrane glutamic endopeptidase [Clostridium lundense]